MHLDTENFLLLCDSFKEHKYNLMLFFKIVGILSGAIAFCNLFRLNVNKHID